ncbi:MAG: hypothetical protein ABR866_05190 [Candidatus Korobacteraceae bacterium]
MTPAAYRPGYFLAIDNNQGKEKAMSKSPLDKAADAAREVLSKIEDVAMAVKADLENLSGIADAADANLDDLYESTEILCREIVDTLQLPSDPVALATVQTIDNLLALLLEAKNYLESGQSLAALGTLQLFDNHADDLKAAIRLTVMAQRRQK